MGEAEIRTGERRLIIHADIVVYGGGANHAFADLVARDISDAWNEPRATLRAQGDLYTVEFFIRGFFEPRLHPDTVMANTDPRLNFFRIESFARTHVSFVDGVACNTGYFKADNLVPGSTTPAHEFGHTLGLDHPPILDIRGKGQPGIMYPRGTLCDPGFQYDPAAAAGGPGGTLNPACRKVLAADVAALRLDKLAWGREGCARVGDFSSVWHDAHEDDRA